MTQHNKISLDGNEYVIDGVSEDALRKLDALQFSTKKIQELRNLLALLRRAKNSYTESLRKEILSKKAGFLFDEE